MTALTSEDFSPKLEEQSVKKYYKLIANLLKSLKFSVERSKLHKETGTQNMKRHKRLLPKNSHIPIYETTQEGIASFPLTSPMRKPSSQQRRQVARPRNKLKQLVR